MFQSHDHHIKDNVCLNRPPYRNGKKLRAVKVYTIAQESKYLLIQNIPSIAGVMEQLLPYFNQYGTMEQYWKIDGYIRKDTNENEQFFDTILIKFVQIYQARLAKCRLDDMNFMGSNLHICYAPEYENLEDLREKLTERRTIVQCKSNLLKRKNRSNLIRKNHSKSSSLQSFQQKTNDIRTKMREIVQKSNLIPLALQQEMKIFILIFFLLISPIELRLRDDDIYELDDLLNNKYDRVKYRPNKKYITDETDDDDDGDQYAPPSSSFRHKKVYPPRKDVFNDNEEYENDDIENELLPKTTHKNDLSDTSLCFNDYNIRSEQLVKVKELKNGAHMIRYSLIDKRILPSNLNVKDNCMLNCCSEKTCDLAMLSEQPTHDGYKCYLFACNGSCTFASHQDYSILIPKKYSAYYSTSVTTKIIEKSTSTVSNVNLLKKKSFFRETSVIIFLIFGIISTIILFIFIFRHCQVSQKRGRKSKNYSVDADYLINGLYL